ncbi:MAG TPA: hypothetical protein VEV82_09960 [Actinomycetota bacterium]|nr:hypothetical protein [Actinomycetota bacterium]
MEQETPRRRRRLSAEDKWQIFTEASAKDARVADVLRRWRIEVALRYSMEVLGPVPEGYI